MAHLVDKGAKNTRYMIQNGLEVQDRNPGPKPNFGPKERFANN